MPSVTICFRAWPWRFLAGTIGPRCHESRLTGYVGCRSVAGKRYRWLRDDEPTARVRRVVSEQRVAKAAVHGVVIGVERMMPGGSGYGTDAAIAAALELAAGQAEQLGIEPGVRLRLIRR